MLRNDLTGYITIPKFKYLQTHDDKLKEIDIESYPLQSRLGERYLEFEDLHKILRENKIDV